MGHVVAVIPIGVHEQLRVGVDRDEGLEVAVALDQVHHVLHLDLRVSRGTMIGVGAGAAAGAGSWEDVVVKRQSLTAIC